MPREEIVQQHVEFQVDEKNLGNCELGTALPVLIEVCAGAALISMINAIITRMHLIMMVSFHILFGLYINA